MWNSPFTMLNTAILASSFLAVCNAIPQVATSATTSPSPSVSPIPWATKTAKFREYLLQQPDQNATKGFWNGPSMTQTFDDGDCLQVRFYNWDCYHDILYKTRGVVKFYDSIDIADQGTLSDFNRYRLYAVDYYRDPDDGWNFYNVARLTFGRCGNRGPQSSCGVTWCVNKEGKSIGSLYPLPPIPNGFSPYADPNDRNITCPWLHGNETTTWKA